MKDKWEIDETNMVLPLEILSQAEKYFILDDGQFQWPAYRDCVLDLIDKGIDPLSDEGVAACPFPGELLLYYGGRVGSDECIDLCEALIDAGADRFHPEDYA